MIDKDKKPTPPPPKPKPTYPPIREDRPIHHKEWKRPIHKGIIPPRPPRPKKGG